MRLTADRLILATGERFHALAIVTASELAIAVAGGLDHIRHTLEDAGFRDVGVHADRPAGWTVRELPAVEGLEWIVWLEATAREGGSFSRALTESLRVTSAWDADDDAALMSPYAVTPAAPARLAAYVYAFGEAYPCDGVT